MKDKFEFFLTQFWVNDINDGSQNCNILRKISEINSSFQSSIKYWFWSFDLWGLSTQFRDNSVTVETVLKNFGKWRQKGAPILHLSPSILQRFCNFSVLKQVLSSYTNFDNDWLKTGPDIRNLVSLLNEKLRRTLPQFWKFFKDDVTNKNTKSGIILDPHLTLTCRFFKSHIFGRCFI